jgi:hypothetical protein
MYLAYAEVLVHIPELFWRMLAFILYTVDVQQT